MATQVTEYRLEIDNTNMKAESYFPGISYDDYDRAGGISPWKICRMFEAGRVVPFYQGNFLDFNKIKNSHTRLFVFGADYYFDPCLWEVAREYNYFPYKITIELLNVGTTSLTIREVLINLLDHKEIATCYAKLVLVDIEKKRPQVFPNWYRTKYQSVESSNGISIDTTIPTVLDTTFSSKAIVGAGDTDRNGHTNQASYIRYCLDAAEMARRAKVLRCLTKDICLYPIVKMTAVYRKETVPGDELSTRVWEDSQSPRILHFMVMLGKDVAFMSTVTFKDKPCSKL